MRYQVTFPRDAVQACSIKRWRHSDIPGIEGRCFGIIREPKYDREAAKWNAKGASVVQDLVYPYTYVVPHAEVVDLERGRFDEAAQERGYVLLEHLGFQRQTKTVGKFTNTQFVHPDLPTSAWRGDYLMNDADEYRVREHVAAELLSYKLGKVQKLQKGQMFAVGVADGSAYYVVTKVNPKTCDVEWRGFCPDRWVDQVLGYGCRQPRQQIERLILGFAQI